MAESLSVATTVNQSICLNQTSEGMYVSTRTRREKYISRNEELRLRTVKRKATCKKPMNKKTSILPTLIVAYQRKDIPERIQQRSSNNKANHKDQKVRRIGMVEATEKELTQKRRQQTKVLLKKFGEGMETAVDRPRIFTKKL